MLRSWWSPASSCSLTLTSWTRKQQQSPHWASFLASLFHLWLFDPKICFQKWEDHKLQTNRWTIPSADSRGGWSAQSSCSVSSRWHHGTSIHPLTCSHTHTHILICHEVWIKSGSLTATLNNCISATCRHLINVVFEVPFLQVWSRGTGS